MAGAAWGTVAQVGSEMGAFGGSLANSLTDIYGYKTQGARYRYGQKGTSKTKAGLISGAYTDLSKELESPEERVKGGNFDFLNTMGIISSSLGLSSSSITQAMNQPSAVPTQRPPNTKSGLLDASGNVNSPSYIGNLPQGLSSSPLDNPSLVSGLKPQLPTNAFAINEGTPDDLKIGGGTSLQGGGKNKGGAVPVEAEGGEWEVSFDKDYTVKSINPVVGAKHEQGGVDLQLPKNHAILNKEQYTRLQNGESLKAILDSVPSVKEAGKAQDGVDNTLASDKQLDFLERDRAAHVKAQSLMNDRWLKSFQTGRQPIPARVMGGEIGTSLVQPLYVPLQHPQYLPPPTADEQTTKGQDISIGLKPNTPKEADFEDSGSTAKGDWKNFNMGDILPTKEPSPIEVDWSRPAEKTTGTPAMGSGFKFGYPEKATLANALQNVVAMLQPRAKGINISSPPTQTPTMVSAHPQNPKATLDEIGKQFKVGLAQLQQTGQSHLIPSLIRSSMDATSKVGEQYAGLNLGAEAQTQAENARVSNQMSMQRTGIDADTIYKNATMELETLKMQGLQDSQRYAALQSLIGGVAQYDKLKQDEQMRNAVYARMLTSMYSTPT